MDDHSHSAVCTADNCFREKMRHIRSSGGLGLMTPKMTQGVSFYDTTIKTEQDRVKAECAAQGWEARVKNPLYDR